MLDREATPGMVAEWKAAYERFRPLLRPNRKSGAALLAFLEEKYPATPLPGHVLENVVRENVLSNECHARKLPAGHALSPRAFLLENAGRGKILYENRAGAAADDPILVGIDLATGYFLVEGSSRLWDELFAYRGLDEEDLNNFFLVAEYAACRESCGTPVGGPALRTTVITD